MKKLVVLLLVLSNAVFAQDTIFKKDQTKIITKIVEVNQDDIKFRDLDIADSPMFTMEKSEIIRIVFSSGKEIRFNPDPYSMSSDIEVRDKTRAIKVEFFSPLTDNITFCYEFMYRVGFNIEAKIALIGLGVADYNKASGAFVKIGPKFLLGSDYVTQNARYAHGLRGRYIKPELTISVYDREEGYYNSFGGTPTRDEVRYASYGVSLVYGRQVILGKTITIDWYFGLGYAYHTANVKYRNNTINNTIDYQSQSSYDYAHLYFGRNFPMTMSAGITVGYMFK